MQDWRARSTLKEPLVYAVVVALLAFVIFVVLAIWWS